MTGYLSCLLSSSSLWGIPSSQSAQLHLRLQASPRQEMIPKLSPDLRAKLAALEETICSQREQSWEALVAGSPPSAAGFANDSRGSLASQGCCRQFWGTPSHSITPQPCLWKILCLSFFAWVGAALSVLASFSTSLVSRNPLMPPNSVSNCCHSCLTTALWG